MAKSKSGLRRVDVFSLKGGVGKTTLSVLLANSIAGLYEPPSVEGKDRKTVLVIDADLTGTCLGDLLQVLVTWPEEANLAHLVCGRPECMGELLAPAKLPVYVYDVARQGEVLRLQATASEARVLFCPSMAETTAEGMPDVQREILQAMLSHENAGGFISFIIERIIDRVKEIEPGLETVIVDHGPGLSALQWANLKLGDGKERRTLFVTSRDAVDLRAIHALEARLVNDKKELRKDICWVVNRVPPSGAEKWQEQIPHEIHGYKDWYMKRALPLFDDKEIASSYAEAGFLEPDSINQQALSDIRERLFG